MMIWLPKVVIRLPRVVIRLPKVLIRLPIERNRFPTIALRLPTIRIGEGSKVDPLQISAIRAGIELKLGGKVELGLTSSSMSIGTHVV